jgi:membrane-bound serine protease (ClpP class)
MEPWVWSVLLLLAGIAIVGIEMFVPSGGALAVMAAMCFIASIVVAFMHSSQMGFMMLGATTLAVPIVIALAVHWWPHTPIGKRILIPRPEHPDDVLPDTEAHRRLKSLVGQQGRTTSLMMPGGTISIDHHTYDAMSLGMPIDANMPVEVVEIRMNRLVVRPSTASAATNQAAQPNRSPEDWLARPIESFGIEDPLA